MQSRASGAVANQYGGRTARALAKIIGATPTSSTSNEFQLGTDAVTVRCARKKTTSVGVTYLMLDRVSKVLAAFENDDGSYSVWSMGPRTFRGHMRPTRSRGPAAGRVGIVSRATFEQLGSLVGTGIRP
jgi:hypothetical protein